MSVKGEFTIGQAGEASCKLNTFYEGLQFHDNLAVFNENSEEQKKWIYQNSSLPSQQINDFSFSQGNEKPEGWFARTITSKNYCSASGNYLVMPLNLVNAVSPVKKNMKVRKSDFILQRSTLDADTLTFILQQGLKVESAPTGKSLKSAFGEYNSTITVNGNKVIYTRRFEVNEGRYKPAQYKEFYDFVMSVSRADNDKVMLGKCSD
jgi:hypothetical protein